MPESAVIYMKMMVSLLLIIFLVSSFLLFSDMGVKKIDEVNKELNELFVEAGLSESDDTAEDGVVLFGDTVEEHGKQTKLLKVACLVSFGILLGTALRTMGFDIEDVPINIINSRIDRLVIRDLLSSTKYRYIDSEVKNSIKVVSKFCERNLIPLSYSNICEIAKACDSNTIINTLVYDMKKHKTRRGFILFGKSKLVYKLYLLSTREFLVADEVALENRAKSYLLNLYSFLRNEVFTFGRKYLLKKELGIYITDFEKSVLNKADSLFKEADASISVLPFTNQYLAERYSKEIASAVI